MVLIEYGYIDMDMDILGYTGNMIRIYGADIPIQIY